MTQRFLPILGKNTRYARGDVAVLRLFGTPLSSNARLAQCRSRLPTFLRKGKNNRFRYPDPMQVKIENERMSLPKAGWTTLVKYLTIVGKVKNVTVSGVARHEISRMTFPMNLPSSTAS
jgi:hypothetical protein